MKKIGLAHRDHGVRALAALGPGIGPGCACVPREPAARAHRASRGADLAGAAPVDPRNPRAAQQRAPESHVGAASACALRCELPPPPPRVVVACPPPHGVCVALTRHCDRRGGAGRRGRRPPRSELRVPRVRVPPLRPDGRHGHLPRPRGCTVRIRAVALRSVASRLQPALTHARARSLTDLQQKVILFQVVRAMASLHERNVVHRCVAVSACRRLLAWHLPLLIARPAHACTATSSAPTCS